MRRQSQDRISGTERDVSSGVHGLYNNLMPYSNEHQEILQQAIQAERSGRLSEAQAAYQRLLARWPGTPIGWYNLGLLQRKTGHYEAALESYQQALVRRIARAEEVHLNRAVVYSDCLRRYPEAEFELRQALRLNPRYCPALLNLANLHEDLGQRAEALHTYETLLAIDAQHFEALARYANLRTITDTGHPLIVRLQQALRNGSASIDDKASLAFALGKALDSSGAYDEAFAAYQAANQYSSRNVTAHPAPYSRVVQEQTVDQLIQVFRAGGESQATVAQPPQPIFICGMFRSGSTLVEQMLASHSQVTAGGELGFLPALVKSSLAPFPQSARTCSQTRLSALAAN